MRNLLGMISKLFDTISSFDEPLLIKHIIIVDMVAKMRTVQLFLFVSFIGLSYESILRLECASYADFSIVLNNITDNGSILKTTIVKGLRQCVLHCISLSGCKAVNYKKVDGSCELVGRGLNKDLVAKSGWIYSTTDGLERKDGQNCTKLSPCENGGKCVDTCSEPGYRCICGNMLSGARCENVREFSSCTHVYQSGFTTNGVYKLSGMGYHYCVMSSMGECSGWGWTLVMKTHGTKSTFQYSANYWTSSNTYNHVFDLDKGMDRQEAKFDAFNKLAFTKICLVFDRSGSKSYLEMSKSGSSMRSLVSSGSHEMSFGRSKWLNLLSGSRLQQYCSGEGINVLSKVRIGIVGNNEHDCATPDSFLGVGGNTVPNVFVYSGNAGELYESGEYTQNVPADVSILVK